MPAIGDDIFFATIPELNAKLKAKEFSAEELARAFTERLQKLGRATTRSRCRCRWRPSARPRRSIRS